MKAVKAALRKYVLEVLRFLARKKLQREMPRIVGVTGSAGKTSTKDAIAAVLERRLKIRKSEKNLNTEFGTVLAVLGETSGYSSPVKWVGIIVRGFTNLMKKPEELDSLVLEMGVDKPGDMDEILKVFKPDVMVFTNVKSEHLDDGQFANRQAIFEEKSKAVYAVPADGWAVINIDDNFVKQLDGRLPANTIKIGTDESADLCAKHVRTSSNGLQFTLCYEGKEVPIVMPHVMGECHVYIALAAIAVGFIHEIPLKTIEVALAEFQLPPGRMNRIEGKNGAILIDSSYNASPDSMEAALEVLKIFHGRRIAALGTMNELGELTESAHLKIGKSAAKSADMLIAVGKHAKDLAEGARREGMSVSMIHVFRTSKEAGEFLEQILERHDVVLIKGSQNNVRMEHVTKACMKEPEQARNLLVRQEPYWLTKL